MSLQPRKFTMCVYILSLKRSLAVKTLSLREHSDFQMNSIQEYLFRYHQALWEILAYRELGC